jgi:hypothetical protein
VFGVESARGSDSVPVCVGARWARQGARWPLQRPACSEQVSHMVEYMYSSDDRLHYAKRKTDYSVVCGEERGSRNASMGAMRWAGRLAHREEIEKSGFLHNATRRHTRTPHTMTNLDTLGPHSCTRQSPSHTTWGVRLRRRSFQSPPGRSSLSKSQRKWLACAHGQKLVGSCVMVDSWTETGCPRRGAYTKHIEGELHRVH